MLKLFNAYHIDNEGEYMIQQLFDEFKYDQDPWYIIHSLNISQHRTQNRGEIDYLIINKRGILVIEVKGKPLMYRDGEFYEKDRNSNYSSYSRTSRNPFTQVYGNQRSLIDFLHKNGLHQIFTGTAVIFAKYEFKYQGIEYSNFFDRTMPSLLDFVINQFDEQKKLHFERFKIDASRDKLLDDVEMDQIKNLLLPLVLPNENKVFFEDILKISQAKLEQNFNILKGLSENKRLMIEGPPGGGKSAYAMDLAKRMVLQNDQTKGLYLCWNEFLSRRTAYRLKQEGLSNNIDTFFYLEFAKIIIELSGTDPRKHDIAEILSEKLMPALQQLWQNKELPSYDFIIVDEGQDLFSKDIDSVINFLLSNDQQQPNGIKFGRYFVFYDNNQIANFYISNKEFDLHHQCVDLLKDHSAIYKLYSNFRAIGGPGIKALIEDIYQNTFELNKDYGNDVKIIRYQNYGEIEGQILSLYNQNNIKKESSVVLFSSNLISGNTVKIGKEKILDNKLNTEEFLKLTNDNINEVSSKIRYSTSLKYKGLEEETAILVLSDLQSRQHDIVSQFFIGASRARMMLYVLID